MQNLSLTWIVFCVSGSAILCSIVIYAMFNNKNDGHYKKGYTHISKNLMVLINTVKDEMIRMFT